MKHSKTFMTSFILLYKHQIAHQKIKHLNSIYLRATIFWQVTTLIKLLLTYTTTYFPKVFWR